MSDAMQSFLKTFLAARMVSTPLVAVRTPDPASSMRAISDEVEKISEKTGTQTPLVSWDVMRGLVGLNQPGKRAVAKVLTNGETTLLSMKPSDALEFAEDLTEDTILFFVNGHRFYDDAVVAQGIWNLRDCLQGQRPNAGARDDARRCASSGIGVRCLGS